MLLITSPASLVLYFIKTINALERFNVWPEMVMAVLYRQLPPILCSPFGFVMGCLSFLAGLQWASLALLTWLLRYCGLASPWGRWSHAHAVCIPGHSGNPGSVALTLALSLLYLHVATRIQTGPTLRENFAVPFLVCGAVPV
jgi:hypothetical protein